MLVFTGGLTAVVVGFSMLLFFEKFMAFNDYLNRNFFIGEKYDFHAFGVDRWIFGQSYLIAVTLLIVGVALLSVFIRYAPY
jgi:hypothetical protein